VSRGVQERAPPLRDEGEEEEDDDGGEAGRPPDEAKRTRLQTYNNNRRENPGGGSAVGEGSQVNCLLLHPAAMRCDAAAAEAGREVSCPPGSLTAARPRPGLARRGKRRRKLRSGREDDDDCWDW
jgi:hypothetical protein